jgi:asparagine synthetase B (glutamine-hydrolysing)
LRANKSTSAWGLEARVPFLDKQVSNIWWESISSY